VFAALLDFLILTALYGYGMTLPFIYVLVLLGLYALSRLPEDADLAGIAVAVLAVAAALFAFLAHAPWPLCIYCEYDLHGVYFVLRGGTVGAAVDHGLAPPQLSLNPRPYAELAVYPKVALPLGADVVCLRGVYARVSYPTAAIDCGRNLPPPARLLKVDVEASSWKYPRVCIDGSCFDVPPGRRVLWYDYRGRVFISEPKANAACRTVLSAKERCTSWPTCTFAYNASSAMLEFTIGPDPRTEYASLALTAEECEVG